MENYPFFFGDSKEINIDLPYPYPFFDSKDQLEFIMKICH